MKHVVFLVRAREPDCSSSVPKSNKSEEQKLLNVNSTADLNWRKELVMNSSTWRSVLILQTRN